MTEQILLPFAADAPAGAEAADELAAYRKGQPWPCLSLDGLVTGEMSAEARDDFALYVNRDFYLTAQIPAGYKATGAVHKLRLINTQELQAMFSAPLSESDSLDSRLTKTYYALQLDWDARDKLGVAPLQERVALLEQVASLRELNEYYLSGPYGSRLPHPFIADMDTDIDDPLRYIAQVGSPALTLQDSAEYSRPTAFGKKNLAAAQKLTRAMLERIGYSAAQAEQKIQNAYALEEKLAPHIFTSDERKKPDYISRINNHFSRAALLELQGALPVIAYVEERMGFGTQEDWLVTCPAYLEAMQTVYTDENLTLLKDWAICKAVRTFSRRLDRDCYELACRIDTELTGTQPLPVETVAAQNTNAALAWQTAHLYCDTYFTQKDKDNIQTVIDEVKAAYKEMLASEDFISPATRALAVHKLDCLTARCLYPDSWEPYTDPALTLRTPAEGGTYLEAMQAIQLSQLNRLREKVRKPVDRTLWHESITPTTVNCFYNPTENSVNILAAFCRGEIYNSDMCTEQIHAMIGMVIGHEISHAFDSTGAQFDENGAFKNWWTEEDRTAFSARVERMAAYFDRMSFREGEPMKGAIMTGEGCADMGAMKCMLQIAAGVPGFDYDLFFKSYARLWAVKQNLYMTQFLAQFDTHPMSYIRINAVVQQFDEFHTLYNVQPGDGMYLAPADRVKIW